MGNYTKAIQMAHSRLWGDGFEFDIQGTVIEVLAVYLCGVSELDDGVIGIWVSFFVICCKLYIIRNCSMLKLPGLFIGQGGSKTQRKNKTYHETSITIL